MKKKRIIVTISILILSVGLMSVLFGALPRIAPGLSSQFHNAIAGCDKIAILDGGYKTDVEGESSEALLILDSPQEIEQFIQSIRFKLIQQRVRCACNGWPAIEFYKGDDCLLRVGVQHNKMLRSSIADHDLSLQSSSEAFFVELSNKLEVSRSLSRPNMGLHLDAATRRE